MWFKDFYINPSMNFWKNLKILHKILRKSFVDLSKKKKKKFLQYLFPEIYEIQDVLIKYPWKNSCFNFERNLNKKILGKSMDQSKKISVWDLLDTLCCNTQIFFYTISDRMPKNRQDKFFQESLQALCHIKRHLE